MSLSSESPASAAAALRERANALHQQILTVDSHIDFAPADLTGERNYSERLETQFNLPLMIEGGLAAAFFIVYVGQTREAQHPEALQTTGYERAYKHAVEKFDAVKRFTTEIAGDKIALALTASDVRRITDMGKKVALIGVENGYPLGADIARVEEFYQRGARYLSLTHNGHNQLGDSHTGEKEGWKWHGVSPLGKQVIAALNRCGIMVDVSHASKEAMLQTAALSKAPIIASHSSCRALCDSSRNLDDEQLLALKHTGGVIQIVAYDLFLKKLTPDSPQRSSALAAARQEFGLPEPNHFASRARYHALLKSLSEHQRAIYEEKLAAIAEAFPGDPATSIDDLLDHVDHAVKLLGIDHVGIASDFDGGGGVAGWNDAGETRNVTLELIRRGYSAAQIAKLWGGNILRVMEAAQTVATISPTTQWRH